MADGSITFSTELDNQQLEKDLRSLKAKIAELENSIRKQEGARSPLVEQAQELGRQLAGARAEAERYRQAWTAGAAGAEQGYQAAAQRAAGLAAEHERVTAQIARIDGELLPAYQRLEAMKEEAGELEKELGKAAAQGSPMARAFQRVKKEAAAFAGQFKQMTQRVLMLSAVTAALRQMLDWFWSVIKRNEEATAAMAKLKGALLTLAQPLLRVVIPAFVALVNVLTRVVSVVAQLVSMLFGGTVQQSKKAAEGLQEETAALEEVGGAAEEAGKSMAGFDQINQLADNSGGSGGGGGAGGAAGPVAPDFEFPTELDESQLMKLLALIGTIGTALLAWRLSDTLPEGLKTFAGLMIALGGAILLAKGAWDAWQNGVDWGSFMEMLGGAALLVTGLGLAFGKTGAAVGLLVSGGVMLVTAFHDVSVNGWNLQNTLLAIAGLLATGLGITLLTGSLIPLLVAGIMSVLLALTTATGNGQVLMEGFQLMLQGFVDFFTGIFTGNIQLAIQGLSEIIDGFKLALFAILDSIKQVILNLLDVIDKATGGKLHGIISLVKKSVTDVFDWVKTTLSGIINAVKNILQGLIEFLTGVFTGNIDLALKGLKNIFVGFGNMLITVFESAVNFIINGINIVIAALNRMASTLSVFGINIGIPLIGHVRLPRIPMLAQGAVIPPNREFLALLGDQRAGNNIEAPEALLRRIVREESGGQEGTTLIMEVDGEQFAKLVYQSNRSESRRQGVRLVEV